MNSIGNSSLYLLRQLLLNLLRHNRFLAIILGVRLVGRFLRVLAGRMDLVLLVSPSIVLGGA